MASDRKENLREQLEHTLRGRICVMGVGNPQYADDGFGVHLAQALLEAGVPDVIVAGNSPDRYLGATANRKFDHLVFLNPANAPSEIL